MNLHIFNDKLGFFTNKTVGLYEKIDPCHNIYLNLSENCSNKVENIKYASVKDLLNTKEASSFNRVFFHGYSYANKSNIKEIKAKFPGGNIQFVWIFWSNEYYQHPVFFSNLYQGFSRKFYLRKLASFHVEHFISFCKREVDFPFYKGFQSYKNSFKEFDTMGALIEGDFDYAMEGVEGPKYSFVSYISLGDFPDLNPDFSVDKSEIMIGHSGSPILNHYEVVKKLSGLNVANPLYIPLAYGKPSYIKALKSKINDSVSNLKIDFQDAFLDKSEYYNRINNIGYFILNSHCQQALGNVFFFLWVGTKVFLNKETSTYKTLQKKGFHIASIEDDLNMDGIQPLTTSEKEHNRNLVHEYINDDWVNEAWLKLLQE